MPPSMCNVCWLTGEVQAVGSDALSVACGWSWRLRLGICSVAFVVQVPTGTVTLLFTDIEGSTRMWEGYPVEMNAALLCHDTIVRRSIGDAGGFVFKTVGDAFCAVFSSATAALDAAVRAQLALSREAWPDPVVIRARMAIHMGECVERDGDYFGPTVNRVARLEAVGHGGQTLLSGLTATCLKNSAPPTVRLRDLGEHRLKDLIDPEHVFQLEIDGLTNEFPPLRSLGNAALRHNLPRYSSSFVGRSARPREAWASRARWPARHASRPWRQPGRRASPCSWLLIYSTGQVTACGSSNSPRPPMRLRSSQRSPRRSACVAISASRTRTHWSTRCRPGAC